MLRQIDKFLKWIPAKQSYVPNLWRREILPSWLTIRSTDAALPVTVPAPAGGSTPPLTIFQPYTSVNGADQNLGTPFEVRSLVYEDSTDGTAAANFCVNLKEVGEARNFMNNPIHIRCLAGTGSLPAILREPYMFLSQHNVSAQFTKVAGGASTMRFFMCGAQYFPWSPMMLQYPNEKKELVALLQRWMNRRKQVSPYWMTTDNQPTDGSIPGSVTIPGGVGSLFQAQTKIGDDSHFEAFGLCVVATGNFNLTLVETKTKQTLMNGAIDQVSGMGNSFFPTIFPTSYLLPAGYRLQWTFSNLIGGSNLVFAALFGRRIWAPINQVPEVLRRTAVPTPADQAQLFATKPLT
jgi:hypothetical protein